VHTSGRPERTTRLIPRKGAAVKAPPGARRAVGPGAASGAGPVMASLSLGRRAEGPLRVTGRRSSFPHAKPGQLVYVRYRDHVLFHNTDPTLLGPCVREVVGWLARETEDAICLCFDRTVGTLPGELPSKGSGLIILKSDILEGREIG